MTRWKITGIVATLVIIFSIPIYVLQEKSRQSTAHINQQPQAAFVSSESCRDCHKQ
jgi:preprotein translocase subunit SecG